MSGVPPCRYSRPCVMAAGIAAEGIDPISAFHPCQFSVPGMNRKRWSAFFDPHQCRSHRQPGGDGFAPEENHLFPYEPRRRIERRIIVVDFSPSSRPTPRLTLPQLNRVLSSPIGRIPFWFIPLEEMGRFPNTVPAIQLPPRRNEPLMAGRIPGCRGAVIRSVSFAFSPFRRFPAFRQPFHPRRSRRLRHWSYTGVVFMDFPPAIVLAVSHWLFGLGGVVGVFMVVFGRSEGMPRNDGSILFAFGSVRNATQ